VTARQDHESRLKVRRYVGWFKYYPGATVPSWIFPLVWPYL
jgi:hypothetical protein